MPQSSATKVTRSKIKNILAFNANSVTPQRQIAPFLEFNQLFY